MSEIAPDLLAANKHSVNQACKCPTARLPASQTCGSAVQNSSHAFTSILVSADEIMGFRTALAQGWQWHALTSRLRPGAGDWGKAQAEGGIRGAIEWRDGNFLKRGIA